MYYPYLRAKQYELLALREYAAAGLPADKIFPIIEPVKYAFNSIELAWKILSEKNIPLGVVLNPCVGEICDDVDYIEGKLGECEMNYTPVFIINNNLSQVEQRLSLRRYRDVILFRADESADSENELISLVERYDVNKIIINPKHKAFIRKIRKLSKGVDIIISQDCFFARSKNSDYEDVGEEFFSEEYEYYKEEGYQGIFDYTVLPKEFLEGGRLPYAIAIHLTYERDGTVFVNHFVSESNDDTSNIQKKYGEAARAAIMYCAKNQIDGVGIQQLSKTVQEEHYPGLGFIKKISILNHLELVSRIV